MLKRFASIQFGCLSAFLFVLLLDAVFFNSPRGAAPRCTEYFLLPCFGARILVYVAPQRQRRTLHCFVVAVVFLFIFLFPGALLLAAAVVVGWFKADTLGEGGKLPPPTTQ